MTASFATLIARTLAISEKQAAKTIELLEGGATLPFISRYRKEATGGLDEVQVGAIQDELERLTELAKRKETILKAIQEQDKLTPELKQRIENSWDGTELEDIYLPYKPKRVTKAEIARKRGLEPLAQLILLQKERTVSNRAESFITGEVPTAEDALQGARDIIAEWINENEESANRSDIRRSYNPKSSKARRKKAQNIATISTSPNRSAGVLPTGFWH